jgi:hypothetical protein
VRHLRPDHAEDERVGDPDGSQERRPGLPVVLTSGFDETHAMAGDHPERPQVFMSKPWSGARLQSAIERAIG